MLRIKCCAEKPPQRQAAKRWQQCERTLGQFKTIIKARIKPLFIAMAILAAFGTIMSLFNSDFEIEKNALIFFGATILFCAHSFWMLTGSVEIEISDSEIKCHRRILGRTFKTQQMLLDDIVSVSNDKNVMENTYTRLDGLRIPDITYSHITLSSKTTSIKIGKGLDWFDQKEILDRIKKNTVANSTQS